MRILGIDVGTSSVKAAVLDVATAQPAGEIVKVPYEINHPTPEAVEVPVPWVWAAVAEACRQTNYAGVEGIGLSCLTPALVLLGRDDKPLEPCWLHSDRRSRPAARQVLAEVGDEFLATTGNRPLPGGMSALCYRQQADSDPTLTGRVNRYLHLHGWIAWKLTGEFAFDPANASFSGLFGTVTDQKWSDRWCDYFEVRRNWLPPIVDGAATVGELRADAAAEMGLTPGLPVKLGSADTTSAVLAAALRPGELLHSVGTTQVLAGLTDLPRPDPRRLTRLLGVGPLFLNVTHNPVGGAALTWLHNAFFREQSRDQFFDTTVLAAIGRPTSVRLDPPFLGGDRLEIEPAYAALQGLSLTSSREDILTAVLNAMRDHHFAALRNLGLGATFRRICLTGGGDDVVRRLMPEYTAETVSLVDEAALRGTACPFRN